MTAPILHKGLWPTVGHLVHTNAAQGGISNYPSSSAIYPQGMTSEYGLRGRVGLVS